MSFVKVGDDGEVAVLHILGQDVTAVAGHAEVFAVEGDEMSSVDHDTVFGEGWHYVGG